jgi:hypothetical protein
VRRWQAIVLAGERPGGNALARSLGLPTAVLAPLAGIPCLQRVVDALLGSATVSHVTLCGPAEPVAQRSETVRALVARAGCGTGRQRPGRRRSGPECRRPASRYRAVSATAHQR